MADYFVRSGATGAGTGADWANAYTTMAAALSGKTTNDRLWVADDHAESTAGAVTLTLTSGMTVYCVDHTVASPGTGDLKTTGSIVTTGATNLVIDANQIPAYVYGLQFRAGNSGATNMTILNANLADANIILENCVLELGGTAGQINLGQGRSNNANSITWRNCVTKFAAAAQFINLLTINFRWSNTASALQGAAVPTTLFTPQAGTAYLDGVDLSAAGTGKTLVGNAQGMSLFQFLRCKLGSGVSILATQSWYGRARVDTVQCDSAATSYVQSRNDFTGALTQETTIVRSGGASDGTTALSHKIVTTSNSRWVNPFESFPIATWNDTVGSSVTATVEIVASGSLNNDDVWLEVEYLGDASSPQASFANNTKANNLATGTALTASSATWASSPGNPQQISVSFTPQQKGYIRATVKVGKASQTVYVDPLITLS